jgi:diguanylate cyclase
MLPQSLAMMEGTGALAGMIEILCTLTGVISGIAVVAALMQQQGNRSRFQTKEAPAADDAERIKGLTNQLQMLTYRVAADVSAHNEKVVHINESLQPSQKEPERILTAITELIHANESMQDQLAAAQMRLTQQTRQIEAAARQARTDALTGLSNRRALDEYLKACIDAPPTDLVNGLLLLDIDHFKSFNDSYGHTTGDAVLASFARAISKWCNGKCYAARYGGEEFAIILSRKTAVELAATAGEVRTFISEQVINHEDLQLKITSSGGLTILQSGDTIQQAYERADEGLYRSKKAGRNCGHWLSDGEWVRLPSNALEAESLSLPAAPLGSGQTPTRQVSGQTSLHPSSTTGSNKADSGENEVTAVNRPDKQATHIDVLDLNTFVERVDVQLKQLGRAELPATAIVVEGIGIKALTGNDASTSWTNTMELVQSQIRGIDLICRIRQYALCVFMPGCSLNAALERAGRMQAELENLRQEASSTYPKRLAIAAATAKDNEACGTFIQRIEYALDEAQDAKPNELVIHDGATCYFQPA